MMCQTKVADNTFCIHLEQLEHNVKVFVTGFGRGKREGFLHPLLTLFLLLCEERKDCSDNRKNVSNRWILCDFGHNSMFG